MKKWIALATGLSLVLSGFAAAGFQPSKVQAADRTGFVQTDGTQFFVRWFYLLLCRNEQLLPELQATI